MHFLLQNVCFHLRAIKSSFILISNRMLIDFFLDVSDKNLKKLNFTFYDEIISLENCRIQRDPRCQDDGGGLSITREWFITPARSIDGGAWRSPLWIESNAIHAPAVGTRLISMF